MRLSFLTISALLFSMLSIKGQDVSNIPLNVFQQLRIFPQEKVYLITDKAAYVAGEQIWFRAFLTDAITHREDAALSRYVYVDLIDPNGDICKHHMIRPDSNGVFHNRIELDDNMAEGTYLLRSYTEYMRARPEYLFEKMVFIADPLSLSIAVEPEFSVTDRKVSVLFRYRNLKDSSFLSVETVKIKVGASELMEFPAKRAISLNINPEIDKLLYLTFTHDNRQYQKFIPIPYSGSASFDVSFFPEGGQLCDYLPTKIGFKALRSNGLSEDISGEIYDSDDQYVCSIQSLHAGMGSFMLTPESGKSYYALCTNKDGITLPFDLPVVHPDASAIRVTPGYEQFVISAHGNLIEEESGLVLIIHMRGIVYYADKMPKNNRITLQTADLPAGIIQVLLLDKEMNPLSERLIFNRQSDFAKVSIVPNQPEYGKRALAKVAFNFEAPEGYDKNGSFAVSVTDDRDILPDSTLTISSYLLLSSELQGQIEGVDYYLNSDPAAMEALETLMLTQGWRRYDIPSVAKGVLEEPDGYIELNQEFTGSVKLAGFSGRPVEDASVTMLVFDSDTYYEVNTDKSGLFLISGFEYPDSTRYLLFASDPKDRRVYIELDSIEHQDFPVKSIIAKQKDKDEQFLHYVEKSNEKFSIDQGMRSYDIPVLTVTARRGDEERPSIYSTMGGGRTVDPQVIEFFKYDIIEILNMTWGVIVCSDGRSVWAELRLAGPSSIFGDETNRAALVVLDDMIYGQGDEPFDLSELRGIPIKSVEWVVPPESVKFGFLGMMKGALLITTDKSTGEALAPIHRAIVTPIGYKRATEFYSPKYETEAQRNNYKPDLRTTIFWKPDVQITDGTAYIEFYTADAVDTSYSITIEGITADGNMVRKVGQIFVNNTAIP